jgi:tRNA nucleotidyltransferase (CCA-adding enzyme)
MGFKDAPALAAAVAREVAAAGGRAYVVGGAVRDALLGRTVRDWDLEVHGLEAAAVEAALARVGRAQRVGRAFPMWKVGPGAAPVDVALPVGPGGAPDPHCGLEAAARRRDLRVNAMAADVLTGEVLDPLGGRADLAARTLRAADAARFGDDPLRAWRVARFAADLGFAVDSALAALAAAQPVALPSERICGELERMLGGPAPGRAFGYLEDWGLRARRFGADGAVDAGVRAALDAVPAWREAAGPGAARAFALGLGVWLAPGGSGAVARVLAGLGVKARGGWPLAAQVGAAVDTRAALAWPPGDAALRAAADRGELALALAVAGAWGAPGAAAVRSRAAALGVDFVPLPPLITGDDLAGLGVAAGPAMGGLLAAVRAAQHAGHVDSPEAARALAGRLWCQSNGASSP